MSEQPKLPIGYWLKRADEIITHHSDAALQSQGLSRAGWQALNSVYESDPCEKESLAELLSVFVTRASLEQLLEDFARRGWLNPAADGRLGLTDAGKSARADALAAQQKVRSQAFEGLSQDDYARVVGVLSRVVANLERA